MEKTQRAQSGIMGPRDWVILWRVWFALFFFSFLLYAATANRGIQWQDSGFHTLRVVTREVTHPLGLALSHPLHHWLGRLAVSINLFDPCYAVTLVSVLAAALTVANVFGCVVILTGQRWAGLFAALSMGVAHTFWRMATITETYTVTTALLSAEWWCLIAYARTRRPGYLLWMMLWNGLGVANHMQATLTTPILLFILYYAYRRHQIRLKFPVTALVLWLFGSLPLTLLLISEFIQTGDFIGTVHSSLFGSPFAGSALNIVPSVRLLMFSGCFVLLNFPNLLLPAAVVEQSAERMSRQAVGLAGKKGMILLEDPMGEFAIRYQAWRLGLNDLPILHQATPKRIRETLVSSGQVVLVPLNVKQPETEPPFGRWRRWGDLYVLDVEGVEFNQEP